MLLALLLISSGIIAAQTNGPQSTTVNVSVSSLSIRLAQPNDRLVVMFDLQVSVPEPEMVITKASLDIGLLAFKSQTFNKDSEDLVNYETRRISGTGFQFKLSESSNTISAPAAEFFDIASDTCEQIKAFLTPDFYWDDFRYTNGVPVRDDNGNIIQIVGPATSFYIEVEVSITASSGDDPLATTLSETATMRLPITIEQLCSRS